MASPWVHRPRVHIFGSSSRDAERARVTRHPGGDCPCEDRGASRDAERARVTRPSRARASLGEEGERVLVLFVD